MVLAQYTIDENTFPAAKFASIASLLNIVIPLLITGAAIVLLIMLLYGAFMRITSGGTPENLAKSQKTITFAILGLVIVIMSFIIVKVITTIFKIQAPL